MSGGMNEERVAMKHDAEFVVMENSWFTCTRFGSTQIDADSSQSSSFTLSHLPVASGSIKTSISESDTMTYRVQKRPVLARLNNADAHLKLLDLLTSIEMFMVFVTVTLLATG